MELTGAARSFQELKLIAMVVVIAVVIFPITGRLITALSHKTKPTPKP